MITVSYFLHVLAMMTWVGGMIYANLILMPSMTAIDPPQRGRLMGAIVKRFTVLSWSSVIILLITGYIMIPEGMLFNFSISYGVWLNIKILIVLLMIIIGLYITLIISPKITASAPKSDEKPSSDFLRAQKQIPVLALTNMILGILALLCIALM